MKHDAKIECRTNGEANLHLQSRVSVMTNCPVRFEFYNVKDPELKYTDEIAQSLAVDAQSDGCGSGYKDRFVKAIRPVLKEHEEAGRDTFNAFAITVSCL